MIHPQTDGPLEERLCHSTWWQEHDKMWWARLPSPAQHSPSRWERGGRQSYKTGPCSMTKNPTNPWFKMSIYKHKDFYVFTVGPPVPTTARGSQEVLNECILERHRPALTISFIWQGPTPANILTRGTIFSQMVHLVISPMWSWTKAADTSVTKMTQNCK